MIPKKIHYCWFGGNHLPKTALKCIESWKKVLPDFEIKEWNEQNFDVMMNDYTKFCYENHLWAFLSDYARLWVVEKEGGVYFDTDVEVVKHPGTLLDENAFYGFESSNYVNTGVGFGAIAHHWSLVEMLAHYENRTYEMLNDEWEKRKLLIGCPVINTNVFINKGLKNNGEMQRIEDTIILSAEYMCPMDAVTGTINKTKNTFSIHLYTMSALPLSTRIRSRITRPLHRLLQTKLPTCFSKLLFK